MRQTSDRLVASLETAHRLWAVVLAGGQGIRLRPLVQRLFGDARPKQYAALIGSRSMLRHTLDRVRLAIPPDRTIVVSVEAQASYLAAETAARAAFVRGRLWNTLVVAAKVSALIDAGRRCLADLHERLLSIAPVTSTEPSALRRAYAEAPPANFSRDVIQQATAALAVMTLVGVTWCDWGSPERVVRSLEQLGMTPPWRDRLA